MEWKVWRFPSTLVPPHTHLPPWPTLHNRGAFVTITTPSPLTLGVPLGVVLSMGFGKCMTFIHITVSYRVDSSTKNLLCSVCSSLPPTPGNHWSFYCLYSFAFSRMSHSLWTFQVGFFHSVICIWGSSMTFQGLKVYFFSVLNNIPLSGYTTVYFIHSPTEGHLGCFQVLTIMNKAAINIPVQTFMWTWILTHETCFHEFFNSSSTIAGS